MDATCSDGNLHTNTIGVIVGSLLTVATFLLPFPQAYKLMRQRSSAGLSPFTIALTVLFAGSNAAATVALKWRQLEACAHGPSCAKDLLDLAQQAASWGTWCMTAVICVSLRPHRRGTPVLATLLSLVCTAALIAAAAVKSADAPCLPPSLTFAQDMGWVAAVAAATQYGPQLLETWSHGSAGSLSFVTYGIQTIGSLAVVVNNVLFNHDTWPVWAPLLVATVMQSGVLLLTVYLKKYPRAPRQLDDVVVPSSPFLQPGVPYPDGPGTAINTALLPNAAAPLTTDKGTGSGTTQSI